MNAKRFFEVAIPQMISTQIDTFMSKHGTISVAVKEQGKWTLQLGNMEEPIKEGFQRQADLKMWFTPDAFEAFLDGQIDSESAMASGELLTEGNVDLLETLGYVLRPSTSVLDVFVGR